MSLTLDHLCIYWTWFLDEWIKLKRESVESSGR